MNHYRCTRPKCYDNPNVPGQKELGARQGYYVNAVTAKDAAEEISKQFPTEVLDVQAWGVDGIKHGKYLGYYNDHLGIFRQSES